MLSPVLFWYSLTNSLVRNNLLSLSLSLYTTRVSYVSLSTTLESLSTTPFVDATPLRLLAPYLGSSDYRLPFVKLLRL